MTNPNSWHNLNARVALQWAILPSEVLSNQIIKVLEARDNREIELMIDFDGAIWWRRDLAEYRELGL